MRAALDRGKSVLDSPRLVDSRTVPGPDVPSFMTRRDGQVIPGRVAQNKAQKPAPARSTRNVAAPVVIRPAKHASDNQTPSATGMSRTSMIFIAVIILILAGGVGYAIYHSHNHMHSFFTHESTLDANGVRAQAAAISKHEASSK